MAGSKRVFNYRTNDNRRFLVFLDESNCKASTPDGLVSTFPVDTIASPFIPKSLKMRYINTVSVDGKRYKRFYIGLLASVRSFLAAGEIIENRGQPDERRWIVNSSRGEVEKNYPLTDTGLTDGTIGLS